MGADLVGVAVDGKAVRGAKREDGTQVQLLAALRHDTGSGLHQSPATTRFPDASRFVIVERESSTLDDVRVSIETRFYVTDLTKADVCVEHLLRLPRGYWSIESLHWVRGMTFDDYRSQVRTGTIPRVLATLRNLAIGISRHTTYRSVNIAAATRQLARQPDTTLDLLGIPPLLCK
jgi:hypothetical protein